jgi:AraC-like DNA-binding protein
MLQVRVTLDSTSPEAAVSSLVARNLLHTVEQMGVSTVALFAAAQLDPALFDTPDARLPRRQVLRLCEAAVEITADPALGLRWAERLDTSAFPPVSDLVRHAATLREAFETLEQFRRLLSDNLGFEVEEHAGKVSIRCATLPDASLVAQRFIAEMIVLGFVRLVRFFNPRGALDSVSFAYPAPAHELEYARVFDGAARFEQPFTGVVFDSALMSSTSPYDHDDVRDALRSVAERRVLRMAESTPYAWRVKDLLATERAPQLVEMSAVARTIGVSDRSLRRRLAAEGTTFDAIANEACAIVVRRLLLERGCTIQEAAFEMSFSSTTAFHRAFKRWTGMTPSELRKAAAR